MDVDSQNQSMLWAGRDLEEHLVLTPCHGQRHLSLDQLSSNLAFNTSRDGAPTTSLGNLCQCLITLRVKNSFLVSHLKLLPLSLKPFSLFLSLHAPVKSPSPSHLQLPYRYWKTSTVCPWSLLQAIQPQISQPVFTPSRESGIPEMLWFWYVSTSEVLVIEWGSQSRTTHEQQQGATSPLDLSVSKVEVRVHLRSVEHGYDQEEIWGSIYL